MNEVAQRRGPAALVESLLRSDGRFRVGAERAPWTLIIAIIIIFGGFYGAVMGSNYARPLQCWYSAVKVPILLIGSTFVCVANFYVINVILGLGSDFAHAFRGILTAQAAAAVALASFAPVTAFIYYCTSNYAFALLLNASIFCAASLAGQVTLMRYYRPLIQKSKRHKIALACWIFLYVFIGVKMGHVLRPFIGDPTEKTTFFRERAFYNNPYTNLFWGGYSVVKGLRR